MLQETYSIQDCILYDSNEYYSQQSLDISLPSAFKITWDSNRKASVNSNCILYVGTDTNNYVQCGTYGSGGNNGIQERINGNWQTAQRTTDAPLNTLQSNTLTYSNGTLSYSNGSQTVSLTPTVSLAKLFTIYGNTNGLVTNIKVKPL